MVLDGMALCYFRPLVLLTTFFYSADKLLHCRITLPLSKDTSPFLMSLLSHSNHHEDLSKPAINNLTSRPSETAHFDRNASSPLLQLATSSNSFIESSLLNAS